MKKLMLMVAMFVMAVAVMAAGTVVFDGVAYGKLGTDKNYAGQLAYLDTVALGTQADNYQLVMRAVQAQALVRNIKFATIAEAGIEADKLMAKFGVTGDDARTNITAELLYYNQCKQLVLDLNATLPNGIENQVLVAYSYYFTKQYDKALPIFIAKKNYAVAFNILKTTNADSVKIFELAKSVLLGKPVSASTVSNVLNTLADINFSDTAVTPDMQIAFLKAVNAKYSRFLITDKATWEPVIANVRTTLEGYGVK